MPPFKNWSEILAAAPYFMYLAASAQGKLLERLTKEQPSLFSNEKVPFDGPWPLSLLLFVQRAFATDDTDISCAGLIYDEQLDFPRVFAEGSQGTEFEDPLRLSDEEAAEIWRMWQESSEMFPDNLRRVIVSGEEYYLGYVGFGTDGFQGEPDYLNAYLFPCKMVDETK